jgi:photosystem II stability/assembly factor-like uncharacterized protein
LTILTPLSAFPSDFYSGLATSSNGEYLFVVSSNAIMVSKNGGSSIQSTFGTALNGYAVACSSTGQYAAVVTQIGNIYVSSNYGQSWTQLSNIAPIPSNSWKDIAVSANGQYMLATSFDLPVYISNNYGNSFIQSNSPSLQYQGVAISNTDSNGQYYAFTVTNDYHLILTDNGGSSWSPLFYDWYGVASSQNGQYRLAVIYNSADSSVFLTSNGGATWSSLTSPFAAIPKAIWVTAACNSDCQYMVLTTYSTQFAISSNYGKSWSAKTLNNIVGSFIVAAVSISSTGQYITAVTNLGAIYVSSNYGNSFTASSAPIATYWATAMSSDGQTQLASSIAFAFSGTNANFQGKYL